MNTNKKIDIKAWSFVLCY